MCKTEEQMKFPCIWVWRATRQSSKLKSVLILILHLQGKWVFCAMRYNNGNASLFPKPFLFFFSSFFFPIFFIIEFHSISFVISFFFFSFLVGKKKSCRALLSSFYHYNRDTQAKKRLCWPITVLFVDCATIIDKQYQILIYNSPNHKRII